MVGFGLWGFVFVTLVIDAFVASRASSGYVDFPVIMHDVGLDVFGRVRDGWR